MNRTVYAVVRRDGIIVALLLSRRECGKVLRQGERIEVMHDVGWPTWAEWVDTLAACHDAPNASNPTSPPKLEKTKRPNSLDAKKESSPRRRP